MNKFELMNVVTVSTLSPENKNLLMELILRSDLEGVSFPSVQRLCQARSMKHEKNFKGVESYLPGLVTKQKKGRRNWYYLNESAILALGDQKVVIKHTAPLGTTMTPAKTEVTPPKTGDTPYRTDETPYEEGDTFDGGENGSHVEFHEPYEEVHDPYEEVHDPYEEVHDPYEEGLDPYEEAHDRCQEEDVPDFGGANSSLDNTMNSSENNTSVVANAPTVMNPLVKELEENSHTLTINPPSILSGKTSERSPDSDGKSKCYPSLGGVYLPLAWSRDDVDKYRRYVRRLGKTHDEAVQQTEEDRLDLW